MAKPHIVLDARLYGPQHRGIGRYTAALAEAISRYNPGYELTALVGVDGAAQELSKSGWHVVSAPYRPYSWQEQVFLPRLLTSLGCDLYHAPHFNVPFFCSVPFVVTIHDLILHALPNRRASTYGRFYYAVKYVGYRILFRRTMRRARRIVAVTAFVAEDLTERFPGVKSKVAVIGEVESAFPATDNAEKVPYTISEPYALVVGAFYPHKNIDRLVRVWGEVYRLTGVALRLVGKQDSFARRIKESVAETSAFQFMGEVSDRLLPELYAGAKAVVVPSLYEGYGLPGREAAKAGALVLSSSLGALPEVYGSAAVYIPVTDDECMRDALVGVLKNNQNGKRAAMPSAETTETLVTKWNTVYESALEAQHAKQE
ncbi:MAG: glycosyltransferase family 1 protein [Patescibacteria group bacterium]|jgi:glycosyltransferase involved in cell wall biosynthesis